MEKKVKEDEKGEAQQQQFKKRKRKDVFPFGNYKNYYGYRVISFFFFLCFFFILILICKANYINKCRVYLFICTTFSDW